MKIVIVLLSLSLFIFADFTISYLIDNKIKQTVYYKDSNHVMFKIEDSEKVIEKLLIVNNKKYLTFSENNIEHIYEISNDLYEDNATQNSNLLYNFNIIRKDQNITFNNFNATRWIVKNPDGSKDSLIVTSNKELYEDLKKSINALKKILPKEKGAEASIFDLGNGYILLKSANLELLSYKKETLSLSLYRINQQLTPNEQKQLSKNIQKCFTSVCCGRKNQISTDINIFLNQNTKNWKMVSSAKCEDETQKNFESAIFENNSKYLTVELISQNTLLGKIDTLLQEGFEIENLKDSSINGYKFKEAYLPSVDATIADISLPNATISIYTKGKTNLKDSAKELLRLKLNSNYTLSNSPLQTQ